MCKLKRQPDTLEMIQEGNLSQRKHKPSPEMHFVLMQLTIFDSVTQSYSGSYKALDLASMHEY